MHDCVAAPVRLPDRDADQPQPLGLVAVGLVALCAGLFLAHRLSRLEPKAQAPQATATDRAERHAGTAHTTETSAATNGIVEDGPSRPQTANAPPEATEASEPVREQMATGVKQHAPQEEARPLEPAGATREATPQVERAPLPEPAVTTREATPQVERVPLQAWPSLKIGIVAYDRCEGLPLGPGRFPCPRDLRLELYVWHALRALERCELAKPERGGAELRFEFERNRLLSMRISKPKRGGIEREVVSKCAGAALSAARSVLSPEYMLVRFRFELR